MNKKYIAITMLSALAIQSTYASVSFTVTHYAPRSRNMPILVIPEGKKIEEYEIIRYTTPLKISRSLHGIKSISWLEKKGGPTTNTWIKYTAPLDLPRSVTKNTEYGELMILDDGKYVDQTKDENSTVEAQAKSVIITDSKGHLPRNIEKGILTNN